MNTYKPQPKPNYTIWDAKRDVDFLQTAMIGLETTVKYMRDEVDQAMRDEWRALHLCNMIFRRLDILESLLLEIVKPEGQQYLTHRVTRELRKSATTTPTQEIKKGEGESPLASN